MEEDATVSDKEERTQNSPQEDHPPDAAERRRLLTVSSRAAMLAGLAGGYGLFGFIAGRFLYPSGPEARPWMYVARADEMRAGDNLVYQTPSGATINVTRKVKTGASEDFIALSSVCPHLGCQVHWEADKGRYFCPCHNGTFDSVGRGTAGPPGDARQSLSTYGLKVEEGLLYIAVPQSLLRGSGKGRIVQTPDGPRGPGHDPCLGAGRSRRTS